MVRAELAEAAARLPELLALALGGEEVLLTDGEHDRLRLTPVDPPKEKGPSDVEIVRRQPRFTREEMIAMGIRPALKPNDTPLPPPVDAGPSLLAMLLEDRENARY